MNNIGGNFNVIMRVSEFCSECKLSAVLSILAKINDVDKEKNDDFEIQAITGKIIHLLIQYTFIKTFDQILFFLIRLKKGIHESIKLVLLRNLKDIKNYLEIVESNHFYNDSETILGAQTANSIMDKIEDHIDIISDITSQLIQKGADGIYYCSLLDNELKVLSRFRYNTFIKGRIDSLAINGLIIKIIDIKTGTSKSNEHSRQVKLYSDILNSVDDEHFKKIYTIKPELWYSNPELEIKPLMKANKGKLNKRKRTNPHIKNPNWVFGELFQIVKDAINKARHLTYEEACEFRLLHWKENFPMCKFCGNLCRYIDEFNLPKKKVPKKDLGLLNYLKS